MGFNFASTNLINKFNFSELNKNLLPYYKDIDQYSSNLSLNKIKIRLIMLNHLLSVDLFNG